MFFPALPSAFQTCLATGLAVCHMLATATAAQPNIIFILVDDYGHSDIGYHNTLYEDLIRTPTLDQLANAGIKLEGYYVQPICTPTRSQLLSGRYQIHTGLQHGVIHPTLPYGLPTDIPLISNKLFELGYRCHKVGKWHLGFYNNASCPWNRGFGAAEGSDMGYLGGMEDYWTKMRPPGFDFRIDGAICKECATTNDGKNGDPSKYSTKQFRLRAVEKIAEHAVDHPTKPMFMYLPFQAVHAPLEAAPFWQKQFKLSDFDGDKNRFTMAAMILEMDFAVGKVVEATQNASMYNNTIFILSADNGGISKGGGYNYPLRGEKATFWEGGARAVGFVHSPLLNGVTGIYKGLIHVSDWFPTLFALGGGDPATVDSLDGHDVWAAITSNGTSPRTELLHNIDPLQPESGDGYPGYGTAALRVGDFKLIVGLPGTATHFVAPGCSPAKCPPIVASSAPGCADDTNATATWLFDIASDPSETCNLAESMPAKVTSLLARLKVYNATAVPVISPAADPASDPAKQRGPFTPKGCWGPWRTSETAN